MSKTVLALIAFLSLLLLPKSVYAQTCSTIPLNSSDQPINLIQNLPPLDKTLPEGERKVYFLVKVTDPSSRYKIIWDRLAGNAENNISDNLTPDSNLYLIDNNNHSRPFLIFNNTRPGNDLFAAGGHILDVSKDSSSQIYCHGSYFVVKDTSGGIKSCTLTANPPELNEQKSISIGGNIQPNGNYYLKIPGVLDTHIISLDSSGNINPYNLGQLRPQSYRVAIQKKDTTSDKIVDTNCQYDLIIAASSGQGSFQQTGTPGPGSGFYPNLPNAGIGSYSCSGSDCAKGSGKPCLSGDGIETAIGCIHTDPVELVKDILKFTTAIAGGIAFLLMLSGAFQMITSAGNADSLKAGQERFKDAIIGLLFILLSVLILKVIGVDILGLGTFLGV